MNHSTPGFPVHHQLPEFTQTHVHRVSDANQPSHPLLSPSPLAFNLSTHQGLFSSSHQMAKVWSFSFSISPSNESSGLISLRFDLLAVQGTTKSLLQHDSSKASVLQLVPHKTAGRTGGETEKEVQVIPATVTLSHPKCSVSSCHALLQGSPLSFPSPKSSFFCLQIRAISRVKAIKNS